MNVDQTKHCGFLRWMTVRTTAAPLLAIGLLAGCSSVPDAINPVEWYRGASDLISGDGNDSQSTDTNAAQADSSIPGENEDFPSLASVPERPSVVTGNNVADGLIADPNKPEYADAPPRQTEDGDLAPPPPPVAVADSSLQPAPPTQSTAPVTSESISVAAVPASTPTLIQPSTVAVAASMPLVVEPGRLPSGETYEEYRARLMAGLETPGSVPIMAPVTMNSAAQTSNVGDLDTVVISSSGIDMTTPYTSLNSSLSSGAKTLVSQTGFQQVGMQGGQPLLTSGSTKIATIQFNSGSSRLDVNDLQVLQKVAALQQQSGGTIRIIGHASSRTRSMDPVRHKMVNYSVSVARADTIAKQLVRLGAPKGQILVGAVSDAQPKFYEVMPSGEAGNRRAEIYIDS